MRAQKRSSLSQRAAEGAERHHDLLDDLGPDWELGVQKNYPEVRCSLCNHDTRAGATGISEFRHVYVGEYPKGPRKGEQPCGRRSRLGPCTKTNSSQTTFWVCGKAERSRQASPAT